jgi:hydrogenase maturation protease
VAVLGIGNLVHADDGVGIHAIGVLRLDPRVPQGVVLVDGGTQGLSLLPHIAGFSRLLVVDAVDAGQPAGSLMCFKWGIRPKKSSSSVCSPYRQPGSLN